MKKERTKLIISIVALVLILCAIGGIAYGYYKKATFKLQNPVVSMEIENYGTVKMELYPEMAPDTVKNFIKLINEGYYNGLTFHRVEKDLLIQGGDKQGNGSGSNEYSVKGEFSVNDYKENTLKFERGVIGLARQDFSAYSSLGPSVVKAGYNTGYAQFFIMAKDAPEFNGYYTAFGKVTEGMDIIDKLTALDTKKEIDKEIGNETETSEPIEKPVIKSITVDTFEIKYGEPELVETFDMNAFLMQYYGLSF